MLKSLPQFEVLTLSYFIAFLCLTVSKRLGKRKTSNLKSTSLHSLLAVFSGVCLFQLFYLGAFRFAPPSHAELINYLWPIFILFGSHVISRERINFRFYVSCVFCLLGLIILFLTKGHEQPKMEYWVGYLFAFGCALSWTFYSLSIKYGKDINPDLNAQVCLVGFVVSLCIHLFTEPFVMPKFISILALLFSGGGVIALAYISWEKGMKQGNITVLSTLSYTVPVASILILVLFDLAEPTWNLFWATLCIAFAGCVSMIKAKPALEFHHLFLKSKNKSQPI